MSKKVLQGILALLGCFFSMRFFLPGIIMGGSYLAQGLGNSPHLDSEVRFLSALAGGWAALYFFLIKDVERKFSLILLIACAVFLGGMMRLVSAVSVGMPEPELLVAAGIEMIIPLAVVLLSRHVTKVYAAD